MRRSSMDELVTAHVVGSPWLFWPLAAERGRGPAPATAFAPHHAKPVLYPARVGLPHFATRSRFHVTLRQMAQALGHSERY